MEVNEKTFRQGKVAYSKGVPREENPYHAKGYARSTKEDGVYAVASWWEGWDRAAYEVGVSNQPKEKERKCS